MKISSLLFLHIISLRLFITENRDDIMENSNIFNSGGGYGMSSQNVQQQGMSPLTAYQMVFPEIYYKLQPYVLMVCDRLDSFESTVPTQDMMDNISDGIYDDVCKRDPELAEYLRGQSVKDDPAVQTVAFGDDPPFFGWRFRRRGLPRDLIEILLLSELFRRRRRFY